MRKRTSQQNTAKMHLGTTADATAIYSRVSTSQQADEGYSLSAQHDKLTKYCSAMSWNVGQQHIYVDAGESGKSTDRPAFQRMMAAARAGEVRRIVAVKLDRVARNVRAFLALVDELQAIGVDLVLLAENFDTGTPTGKFALTMFAAMAELERSTILERVMSGKKEAAQLGKRNGGQVPLGYDAEFNVIDAEAAIVRRIFAEFVAGSTMQAIAKRLHDDGVPTKNGGKWATATVKWILGNGRYANLAQWNSGGVTIEAAALGSADAIIDADTYEKADARMRTMRRGRRAK